ncbi:hypothetical protein CFAM422_009670 [Trichoderma lentiforme]|uniref:Uncharacterized protein n=1 Tax=Trichoderma lentiforme TaxID=1567552 RepID=A0A9P4XA02_9HYPO|nr:hypothetical protein CFAM422_009670 [Trichoderma lentiforme]
MTLCRYTTSVSVFWRDAHQDASLEEEFTTLKGGTIIAAWNPERTQHSYAISTLLMNLLNTPMHLGVHGNVLRTLCRQGAPTNDLSTTDRFSLADRAMFCGDHKEPDWRSGPKPHQSLCLLLPSPVTSPPSIPPPPIQSLEPPPMTDVLRYLHRSLSPSQQVSARWGVFVLSI